MENKKQLNQEVQVVRSLQNIVTAYEEIYTIKMEQIRDTVLKTRNYVEGLSGIFKELKVVYREKIISENQNAELTHLSLSPIEKNGKKVAVLLTSDRRFSGDINQRIFYLFKEYVTSNTTDIVVAGRIGKEMMKQHGIKKKFTYFDISEDELADDILRALVNELLAYEQVEVFYGKFLNLLQQTQSQTNLTGREEEIQDIPPEDIPTFLFEPSLEEILTFFETQVFASMLEQTINESRLAHMGARVTTMEEASQEIDDKLKELNTVIRRITKQDKNKQQQQRMAGLSLWNK